MSCPIMAVLVSVIKVDKYPTETGYICSTKIFCSSYVSESYELLNCLLMQEIF